MGQAVSYQAEAAGRVGCAGGTALARRPPPTGLVKCGELGGARSWRHNGRRIEHTRSKKGVGWGCEIRGASQSVSLLSHCWEGAIGVGWVGWPQLRAGAAAVRGRRRLG